MLRQGVNCISPSKLQTDAQQTISQWPSPPLSVLDNRAATLTKLGNLPGALRDGRKMIQMGKTDVTVGDPFFMSERFTGVFALESTPAWIGSAELRTSFTWTKRLG